MDDSSEKMQSYPLRHERLVRAIRLSNPDFPVDASFDMVEAEMSARVTELQEQLTRIKGLPPQPE